MNRNGISVLKLGAALKRIFSSFVIKADIEHMSALINFIKNADIAVKYSKTLFIGACPRNVIVIFNLHKLISLSENTLTESVLALMPCRGINHTLKNFIQIDRSRLAFS